MLCKILIINMLDYKFKRFIFNLSLFIVAADCRYIYRLCPFSFSFLLSYPLSFIGNKDGVTTDFPRVLFLNVDFV